jgi:hypothetical protein
MFLSEVSSRTVDVSRSSLGVQSFIHLADGCGEEPNVLQNCCMAVVFEKELDSHSMSLSRDHKSGGHRRMFLFEVLMEPSDVFRSSLGVQELVDTTNGCGEEPNSQQNSGMAAVFEKGKRDIICVCLATKMEHMIAHVSVRRSRRRVVCLPFFSGSSM